MYFDEFTNRLNKEDVPSVSLLFGEASGVIAEALRTIKEKFRKAHPEGALMTFDGVDHGLGRTLEAARTSGLFAVEQLIILERADKAIGGQSDAPLKELKEYFSNPNPASRLVFLAPGAKKTSKTVSTVERLGWTVQCSDIPEWKMVEWVARQAKEKGIQLSEGGARLLLAKTGTDPAFLRMAIEQLRLYVFPAKMAGEKDVAELPVPGLESGIFELQDEVGLRHSGKALQLMTRLSDGVDVGTVMMLYMRMRELLGIALIRQKGGSQSDAAQQLGLHPFRLKALWEQSSNYTAKELKEALKGLISLQAGIVTGRLGKKAFPTVLERWVMKWGTKSSTGTRSQIPMSR